MALIGAPEGAQSVEHPTLDFGSGHDLAVGEFKPHVRLCLTAQSLLGILSLLLPLSLCPSPAFVLSHNIKTLKKKINIRWHQ